MDDGGKIHLYGCFSTCLLFLLFESGSDEVGLEVNIFWGYTAEGEEGLWW
jgi:hypothetical protein